MVVYRTVVVAVAVIVGDIVALGDALDLFVVETAAAAAAAAVLVEKKVPVVEGEAQRVEVEVGLKKAWLTESWKVRTKDCLVAVVVVVAVVAVVLQQLQQEAWRRRY